MTNKTPKKSAAKKTAAKPAKPEPKNLAQSGEQIKPKHKSQFMHGWNPDLPDKRDHLYHASKFFQGIESVHAPPAVVDLRAKFPAIRDQGNEGSCTGHGGEGVMGYMNTYLGGKVTDFSPAFIYYCARIPEGTTSEDSGASIRDMVKGLAKYGAATEKEMPYKAGGYAKKPTKTEFKEGLAHQALEYLRVENDVKNNGLGIMKQCLAANYPIVFGATLYESFENPGPNSDGMIPMPKPDEAMLGGHCMVIVGYDDVRHAFLVRNSWGTSWGVNGYHWMPYAYLTDNDLCDDFWTLRRIENPK